MIENITINVGAPTLGETFGVELSRVKYLDELIKTSVMSPRSIDGNIHSAKEFQESVLTGVGEMTSYCANTEEVAYLYYKAGRAMELTLSILTEAVK